MAAFARHRDGATVRFDDVPGNGHTKAAPERVGRVRAPIIALENVRQFARFDADAVVLNRDHILRDGHMDGDRLLVMEQGVIQEVEQRPFHEVPVDGTRLGVFTRERDVPLGETGIVQHVDDELADVPEAARKQL